MVTAARMAITMSPAFQSLAGVADAMGSTAVAGVGAAWPAAAAALDCGVLLPPPARFPATRVGVADPPVGPPLADGVGDPVGGASDEDGDGLAEDVADGDAPAVAPATPPVESVAEGGTAGGAVGGKVGGMPTTVPRWGGLVGPPATGPPEPCAGVGVCEASSACVLQPVGAMTSPGLQM